MKPIPESVRPRELNLQRAKMGKVCQIYHLPGGKPLKLKEISDRISVHDIILPFLVPNKGVILNFIDHFWRLRFKKQKHDLLAVGCHIDAYVPADLRAKGELQRRCRVIAPCMPLEAEIIYRWLLTGTGLKQYKRDGKICGQQFPAGLKEWDELNPPAFTPTTKSEQGHDEPMDVAVFLEKFGQEPIDLTRPVFEEGRAYAAERGVIIADTKFEVGTHATSLLALIDEILTPDSSRYLRPEDVENARRNPGTKPPSFDKQPIRDYVAEYLGVDANTPLTAEIVRKVQEHKYPEDLIAQTSDRYHQLQKIITGRTVEEYAAYIGCNRAS